MPILGVIDSAKTNWLASSNFESIASATAVGGSNTTVTFNTIPQTYTHLRLHILCATFDANVRSMLMYYNNDQSATYSAHAYYQSNGTVYARNNTTTQWNVFFPTGTNGIGAASNFWSAFIIDIYDYKDTSKYKTSSAIGGFSDNTNGDFGYGSGLWLNTNAVSRIDLMPTFASGWRANSTFALYGIK